ncbi:CRISPR-associated helicase Cas3' [Streptomyces sp. NBC_01187]|uniref:CRISPR-associated helicase Cas3' n=1 Tax=Streptomyces sp. NBC_01187 TaxID=2903766 RepID=UPI002F90FF6F|nr:CRISPR-associated helicase Cas3' [Streptomyces sp. NBC_01187]
MSGERANLSRWLGLSSAARSVWAKYDRLSDGWVPLWRHMADTGSVAGLLWDHWVPAQVRRLVSEGLPEGEDDARRLAVWLAGVHDIGKATPAFACQVELLAARMRDQGLSVPLEKQLLDRRLARHALAGQVLLKEWLVEQHGWAGPVTAQLTAVVGGHHGVPPEHWDIKVVGDHPELLRDPPSEEAWRSVQWELLDACSGVHGVQGCLGRWRGLKLSQPVQVLLSALVIVGDWIASNADLFPYFPEECPRGERARVEGAWEALGLPPPWRAVEWGQGAGELFVGRFSLPRGARVRPVQESAVGVAREMAVPGLMVIEAPMGEGKTEAALAVAEVFAARSGAGGCFVALPTMATGNAMFSRLLAWLGRVPDEREEPGAHSVFLAHSKSALNADYQGLRWSAARGPAAVELDGAGEERGAGGDFRAACAELVAHQWLRGRKKGMLSSFVVGTVDQLLFAGLKSRHLALRHLALAGKVVVVDEAHAYDAYMNSYLDVVLSWLGAYRVPVVVLSATLPARRRRELAEAYAGTGPGREGVEGFAVLEEARGYPLLACVAPGSAPRVVTPQPSGRGTEVVMERCPDDVEVLADRLEAELADGGCALVVRNTVERVLEAASRLRRRFGEGCVTVAHARFVDLDRAAKEADLLARFGPPRTSAGCRPEGPHIVVATQVVEQSLDIDFDLLVTDLCPVDLLLQRLGRVHRHPRGGEEQRGRPPGLRTARCLVTGVEWSASPPVPVKGSCNVYGEHALLRSLAVLEPFLAGSGEMTESAGPSGSGKRGKAVRLPEDISALVQSAYGPEEVGPGAWQEAMDRAADAHRLAQAQQMERAEVFQLGEVAKPGRSLVGWVEAGVGDADDTRKGRAQVRDSRESLEVLVLQQRADGSVVTVPWLGEGRGGLELPTDAVPSAGVARVAAACGLRLPFVFSLPAVLGRAIEELEGNCFRAWQAKECPWLAGELILLLDEECHTRLAGYDLRYTPADGLEVTRAG